MLVALAAGTGAGAGGCGSDAPSGFGDVMLTVTVPGDVLVRSADYELESQARTPMTGTLTADAPVHDLNKLIAHVPVGQYTATAHAEATDHRSECEGTATLEVTKGATARAHVVGNCRGAGQLVVTFGVDCRATPLVDLLVSPLAASVGEQVIARADPARPDGGALAYAWAAPSGTFSDQKARQTAFTCGAVGPVELTLHVVDSQACEQTHSATVTCLPPLPVPDGGADTGDAWADIGAAGNEAGAD
jgi:hypothetical protein